MAKKSPKRGDGARVSTREKNGEPKKPRNEAFELQKWQKGFCPNPAGRPKGSRNKFAEEFIKDFLADWQAHGAAALKQCREVDPAAYVRVASTLLPKDFNVNFKGDEAALEKLLDQFDDKQLQDLVRGLSAVGASSKKEIAAPQAGAKSDKVH